MERKTIILISLIAAIISMIYVILDYFGIIRYIKVFLYSPEQYIKDYKKLDKIYKDKVVISLTTTPNNMKKLKPVINSLLDQTVQVDLISLCIPEGNNEYKLPSELKDAVAIFRCGNDEELNPLISTIMREGESTTSIIVLGDDYVYGKDFIETLIEKSNKNPNDIICVGNSINLKKGALFKTDFFKQDFLDKNNQTPDEFVNDYFKNHKQIHINYYENYKR
jgi:hypothetical protein